MENFEIPERITAFDSRMKLIAAHYYRKDKQTRTENFKRLFNACDMASIRRELEKYWASMPLRLAKKSAKQDEMDEIKLSDIERRYKEIDENKIIKRYGGFLKNNQAKVIADKLARNHTEQKVKELFDSYCYMYKETMLARFLLACYKPQLSSQPENLRREVKILLE